MCGRTGLFIKSNNQKISFQVEHTFKNYGPGVKYVQSGGEHSMVLKWQPPVLNLLSSLKVKYVPRNV